MNLFSVLYLLLIEGNYAIREKSSCAWEKHEGRIIQGAPLKTFASLDKAKARCKMMGDQCAGTDVVTIRGVTKYRVMGSDNMVARTGSNVWLKRCFSCQSLHLRFRPENDKKTFWQHQLSSLRNWARQSL